MSYVERLGHRAAITVLSFEKPSDLADPARVQAMRDRLGRADVAWVPRPYHKRPAVLSTAWDVARGCAVARGWAASGPGVGLVHARGYVPSLVALDAKRVAGARYLFDMRGFWVDEKVEAGHWSRGGLLHRVGKRCERRFLAEADAVVSLTHAGVRELPSLGRVRDGVPVVVIPTCADLDRFAPGARDETMRQALGLAGAAVVGCVGTLSNWYLRRETLSYLAWMLRRTATAKALVVTREDHARLRVDAIEAGVPADRLVLTDAPFSGMPELIRQMDIGLFFIRPCFSKRASAATKLAEFLGCGVPVVINDGVGDSGQIVRNARVGVVLPDVSSGSFEASAPAVDAVLSDPEMRPRCRRVAEATFSLNEGVAQYAALYASV